MKAALLVITLVLASCVTPLRPEQRGVPERGDGRELPPGVSGGESRPGITLKVVYAKQEPATLLAADRTGCTVSEKRFRETIVGEQVWCDWRKQ